MHMETPVATRAAIAVTEADDSSKSGVSWGAVFAGAAAAAALSYILVILGFGLGLSSVSPWANSGVSATAIGVATIVWLAFTQIAASAMGGYLAGRLRVKWANVHSDEVYFRDTAHGFLSWAIASLVVAAFLASAVSSIVSGGASVVGAAAGGAATTVAAGAAATADASDGASADYFVDSLFRSAGTTPTADGTPTATTGPTDRNVEAGRIFARSLATGSLPPADKQYLGQVVASRTGLGQAEAEQRVDQSYAAMVQAVETAKTKAKEAADQARKAAAGLSLWMFVSLLCGAFFASLAATFGGKRRDLFVPITTRATR